MEKCTFGNIVFGSIVRCVESTGACKRGEEYVVVGYHKPGPRDSNGFMLDVTSFHTHDQAPLGSTSVRTKDYSMHVSAFCFETGGILK